jgi:hypothetical protein
VRSGGRVVVRIGGVGEAKLRYDYITGRYWDDDPVKPAWEREAREF